MSAMMEHARAVRMVGVSARAFAAELAPLLRDLAEALIDVALILAQLGGALARPLARALRALLAAAGPPAAAAGTAAWGLFVRQSPEALALEAAAGVALLAVAAVEARFGLLRGVYGAVHKGLRAIAIWYRGVRRGVREKSRLAAVLLSHVVFMVPVLLLCAWARGNVGTFVQKYGLHLVSCAAPAWKTAQTLYRMEEEEEEEEWDDYSDGNDNHDHLDDGNSAGTDEHELESDEDQGARSDAVDGKSIAVVRGVTPPSEASVRRRKRASAGRKTALPAVISQRPPSAAGPRTPVSAKTRKVAEFDAREQEAELLRFWSVFGVVWAARSVARYFTPALFEALLDRLDTFLFFFLIWLQISLTRGADVLFPLLASALRQSRYLRANATTGAEQLNIFLRVLVSVGAVPPERAAVIASTLTESGVVLIGIVFFITPRSATFIGTLLTGYAVPVYISVYSATPASQPIARHTWLSYWTAFSVVEAGYAYLADSCDWIPLWYHFKLALILWLQVPYYRGAASMLDSAMANYGRIVSRFRKKVVSPRKRRIA